MLISNCCSCPDGLTSLDGPSWSDLNRCPCCKEYCEFVEDEAGDDRQDDLSLKFKLLLEYCENIQKYLPIKAKLSFEHYKRTFVLKDTSND